MTAQRPCLAVLADRLGIVDAYWDLTGERRETSDVTRERLCAAMGYDAHSEAQARRALDRLEHEDSERVLDAVCVLREHAGLAPDLLITNPPRADEAVTVELEEESGARHARETALPHTQPGRGCRVALPARPGPGAHRVTLSWHEGGAQQSAQQLLVVAPRSAWTTRDALGDDRGFGVWANAYSLRSERSGHWGFGDLTDVATLSRRCGEWGGDFVGLSPLHAIPARGDGISPYAPTSRLYRSLLYLDVEAVPELALAPAARARLEAPAMRRALACLRRAEMIDYDAVRSHKLRALRELHDVFAAHHLGRSSERGRAYAAYRASEGQALVHFATFEVLAEECGVADWRLWPEPLREANSAAVTRFRDERAADVELHCWIQFELDRQLGVAAAAGRDAGLRIGLYTDLAVGSSPGSADTWMFKDVFALGASVGAPPDAFAADGQVWGVAPLDPHRLRDGAYDFFVRLLRAGFGHAGALRIDHVMGLQRLFWIPEGHPPCDGAYVRYPRDELLGVAALESRRHRALVVGEDLGTVPPELPRELASWGILSSAVLTFESTAPEPQPASHVSARSLASANTHDLAPLAGWVAGSDLLRRREAGATSDLEAHARALEQRAGEVERWARTLRQEGVLASGGADAEGPDWLRATCDFLAHTPAPLVAISLDDLAGETEPVHLPGIGPDRWPGWSRRMRREIEALPAPRVGSLGRKAAP